ncbi:MFS transporter [Okibacterium endophyticum]
MTNSDTGTTVPSGTSDESPRRTPYVPGPRASLREWVGLGVLGLASLLVSIDVFVLLLALPSIATDLGASATQQLWIMDVYGFLLVGFMLTAGTLGDRIGRRRLLLIGGAAFAVASVIAAFSTSAEMLIAARALLGVAGATLAPSTLGLISTMFRDARQRGVAIGLWMVGFMGGAAIGPVIGGVLLENFWWGSVFLLGVPAMVLLLVLGPILLPEERDPNAGRIDLISVVLSLAGILPLVAGLKELASNGWGILPFVSIVVGLVFGWLFVRRQRLLADPIVDFSLFRNRAFTTVVVGMMMITVMGSLMLFTAQYLQLVAGLTPLQAGFAMLPAALTSVISFGGAPFLAQRIRPVWLTAGGMAVAAVGCLLYVTADASASADDPGGLIAVICGLAVMNLGCGPFITLGTGIVVSSVPSTKVGSASAMSETSAELGYGLGIAVMGSIGTIVYRLALSSADAPASVASGARESLAGAVTAADALGSAGETLLVAAREAFMTSVHVVGWATAAIALMVGVLALVNLRHVRPLGAQGDANGEAAPDDSPNADPMRADRAAAGAEPVDSRRPADGGAAPDASALNRTEP